MQCLGVFFSTFSKRRTYTMISTHIIKRTQRHLSPSNPQPEGVPVWKRVAGVGGLAFACLASPCCAPLYVPVILSLLAGTPIAAELSGYIGWIYAAFTALSVVSFVIGGWLLLTRRTSRHAGNVQKETGSCACQMDCSCRSAAGEGVQ